MSYLITQICQDCGHYCASAEFRGCVDFCQDPGSVRNQLLEDRAARHERCDGTITALHWAAVFDRESTKLLLDQGVMVDSRDAWGSTPLMHAASCGSPETIKLLLLHGAIMGSRDSSGFMPLMYAASCGSLENVKLLLLHGANANARTTPAQEYYGYYTWAPNAFQFDCREKGCVTTVLHGAALFGRANNARVLLEHGAVVDARDFNGYTPLMRAVGFGFLETAKVLLSHRANINATTTHGECPSFGHDGWCISNGTSVLELVAADGWHSNMSAVGSMTQLLLGHGARWMHAWRRYLQWNNISKNRTRSMLNAFADVGALSATFKDGDTALTFAVGHRKNEAVKFLLLHPRIDVNLPREGDGQTALHVAAKHGELDMVSMLLEHGADRLLRDDACHTARDVAIASGQFAELEILSEETLGEALIRLSGQWEAVVAMTLFVIVVLTAMWRSHWESNRIPVLSPPASRGATVLASEAQLRGVQRHAIRLLRAMDMFVATTICTRSLLLINPKLWMPTWLLLYGIPALHLAMDVGHLDLTVLLTIVPSSLLSTKQRTRHEIARCAFALCRAVALLFFMSLPWDERAWYSDTAGHLALEVVKKTPGNAITLPQPLLFNMTRWLAWKLVDGPCNVSEDGCMRGQRALVAYQQHSCQFQASPYKMTHVMNVTDFLTDNNPDCSMTFIVNGVEFKGKSKPQGVVPLGSIFWMNNHSHCRFNGSRSAVHRGREHFVVCPMAGKFALITPSVGDLWVFGHLFGASLGYCVVVGAFAATSVMMWQQCCRGAVVADQDGESHHLLPIPCHLPMGHQRNSVDHPPTAPPAADGATATDDLAIAIDNIIASRFMDEVLAAGQASLERSRARYSGMVTFSVMGWHTLCLRRKAKAVLDCSKLWLDGEPTPATTRCVDGQILCETATMLLKAADMPSSDGTIVGRVVCVAAEDSGEDEDIGEEIGHFWLMPEGIPERLQLLRGMQQHVKPVGHDILDMDGVYFIIVMLYLDVVFDMYTIYLFICNEDIWFASISFLNCSFFLTYQLYSGRLQRLATEMEITARTGRMTKDILHLLDEENGFETVISLVVSSYGLPFAAKTPVQILVAFISVLLSCKNAGNYLYRKIDLCC